MAEPIGDTLRRARTERGLELDAVSDATKIRVRYLRALEAEDWEALPAPAYARGFLRTYAGFLGLDADALVESFRRAAPEATGEAGAAVERQPLPPAGGRSPPSLAAIAVVAAIVLVLGGLFLLGQGGSGGGGGNKSASGHGRSAHHHRHHRHHQAAPKPPPAPAQASIELRPTGTVWVCLVDQSGRALVNGEILSAGDSRGPFRADAFDLGLGNGEIAITANGRAVAVPSSPSPLAFRVDPDGARPLSPAKRPTCA
jgi:transcriptional regulator with XRE-family HTH domain